MEVPFAWDSDGEIEATNPVGQAGCTGRESRLTGYSRGGAGPGQGERPMKNGINKWCDDLFANYWLTASLALQ
jgi:hypothetical protein